MRQKREKEEMNDTKDKATKLGTTLPWEKDREIAQKSPKTVVPNIPGAFLREKRIKGLVYYQLVKSYRIGEKIAQKVLVHYGLRPPRGANKLSRKNRQETVINVARICNQNKRARYA